jgi:undecaprenyl diphosphate synthase
MKKIYLIKGRVQGVTFRSFIKRLADDMHVKGYARNNPDGSLSVLADSDIHTLNEFLTKVRQGNLFARVDSIQVSQEVAAQVFHDFKIITNGNIVLDKAKSVVNLVKNITNSVQNDELPKNVCHIAIIPDGNRRWARERGWHAWVGHRIGMQKERFDEFFDHCINNNIKYFSFWGFSTENWDRDEHEIAFLWDIYRKSVKNWEKDLHTKNIRVLHAGRKDRLPKDIVDNLEKLVESTKNNTSLTFVFCLDYGGRDDIVRAVNMAIRDGVEKFDQTTISKYLDTKDIPDPDLIIRTGGEKRLSGFMAYQSAYAELFFTDKYFPDFWADELLEAIADYTKRIRRFGGDSKKDLVDIDTEKLFDPIYESS